MTLKNTTTAFLFFLSFVGFSQNYSTKDGSSNVNGSESYLDSIKNSFVSYDTTQRVDSLWMNQVINFDLYADVDTEINTVNIDKDIDNELPTTLLKERLAAMDAKSPFNIEYNQGLENLIKSFLKHRRKAFENQMAISEYYFPIFEEALAKLNVPLEIKYLAVVESALNPKAVSKMGSTGLWQFMYHTGKQFNLNIDSYVDERSDPLKSSTAAAQYMSNMFSIFNDWDLVLASYNSGPGNVTKAIRRSGGLRNFWNIKKNLPKETQGYVPAFLATMYIYEYHTAHGIVPKKAVVQHFETDTIMIKREMSFAQISDLLDVPVAQLEALNPSYKRNVVPYYNDRNHFLTLPIKKAAVFAANEDKIYAYAAYQGNKKEKTIDWRNSNSVNSSSRTSYVARTKFYKVKRGDNLGAIADKNNVSVADLKKWNHLKGNTIAYGKSLKIMTAGTTDKAIAIMAKSSSVVAEAPKVVLAESKVRNNDSLSSCSVGFYTVVKGDNLGAIASKNNVTVAELKEWNNLTTNNVRLGAFLQVSSNQINNEGQIVEVSDDKIAHYVVQKGDNLESIAKKFGSSLKDIKQWNNLSGATLAIGKSLIVTKNEAVVVTNNANADSFKKKDKSIVDVKSQEANYLVKKGDSLFSISKQYPGVTVSDLKEWNNITGDELKPGMGLKILL